MEGTQYGFPCVYALCVNGLITMCGYAQGEGVLSMAVFEYRKTLIDHYAEYVSGFIKIRDERISESLNETLTSGHL